MIEKNKLEDDGLTDEQRALDAKMVAAGFEKPPYATIAARSAKKRGNRRRVDKRFKVNALDDSPANSVTSKNEDDPWDSKVPVSTEVIRIAQLVRPYFVRGAAFYAFRPDINKQEMIAKVFQDRQHSTANLLKLYAFMQTKYTSGLIGMRCLSSSPLFYLVEEILLKEGAITEPLSQTPSVTFGGEFDDCPAVVGEAK